MMLIKPTEEDLQKFEEWLARPVPSDFFKTAGKLGNLAQKRFDEIPEEYKPTAFVIISLTNSMIKQEKNIHDRGCLKFRCLLFELKKKLEEDSNLKGVKLYLPFYWYTDGPMFEPKNLALITNGVFGMKCDESRDNCGIYGTCVFSSEGV